MIDLPEVESNVKVLLEGSTYHWRDASNRALCDRRQEGELTPYGDVPALTFLCIGCRRAVEQMTKGW